MWICYALYAYYAHLAIPHCSIKNVHFGKKWQCVWTAFIYATVLFLGHTETNLYPFVSKTKCCDFYFFSLQLMFQSTPPCVWSQIPVSSLHCCFSHFTEFSTQDPSCSTQAACLPLALSWVWCLPGGGCKDRETGWKGLLSYCKSCLICESCLDMNASYINLITFFSFPSCMRGAKLCFLTLRTHVHHLFHLFEISSHLPSVA